MRRRLCRLPELSDFTGREGQNDRERACTYSGAIEEGDIQIDNIQMHAFTLYDGVQVAIESPSLNQDRGKLLY
jgi:hypothetical protein